MVRNFEANYLTEPHGDHYVLNDQPTPDNTETFAYADYLAITVITVITDIEEKLEIALNITSTAGLMSPGREHH